jgi:hypothetical protein
VRDRRKMVWMGGVGLQAIADGHKDYEASDEDQEALQSIVTDDMTKCMTDAAK